MDALQRPVPRPKVEIVVHRALRRQVLRQCLPLAAGRQHVEDAVQNFAYIDRALASATLGWRDQRFNQPPLRLAQVAGIAQTLALRRPAMYVRPHVVPLQLPDTTYRITSDSTDSTTFRNASQTCKAELRGFLSCHLEHG